MRNEKKRICGSVNGRYLAVAAQMDVNDESFEEFIENSIIP